jgi:5-methylcytosine-specific restriction enzyme subunit McrC
MDMNRVVEDFVVVALRDALGVSERTLVQGCEKRDLHLGDVNRVGLEPDISWWEGARCRWVGDVKYKSLVSNAVDKSDVHQMLAYLVGSGTRRGALVYASDNGGDVSYQIGTLNRIIEVRSLSLLGTPDELLTRVAHLAKHIRLTVAGNRVIEGEQARA